MGSAISYRWSPIEDLPRGGAELGSGELRALAEVWTEQKGRLQSGRSLLEFNERLSREWAIETGIIERVYTLDRGITEILVEHGIDASLIPADATDRDPGVVARMIQDHKDAIDGIFDFVRGSRPFGSSYLKELHSVLLRHQESTPAVDALGRHVEVAQLKGQYKQLPNNPTLPDGSLHEYCPPESASPEVDQLLTWHGQHQAEGAAPEVEAAWLHHRFTQIHPFQDGNGRVARAIASLVFIRAGWFPLVIRRDDRVRYIEALEDADLGDLRPLVSLFASNQRRAFVGALGVAGDVMRRRRVDEVIELARDVLERRREELKAEWARAEATAERLLGIARERFTKVSQDLQVEVGALSEGYRFWADAERAGGARDFWHRYQVIETAKQLGYFANLALYRAWVRLGMRTEGVSEIVLSFHGIGHEFRGVLGVSMCYSRRDEAGEDERRVSGVQRLGTELFQVNYREPVDAAAERFRAWVDDCLVEGLECWRQQL